MIPNTECIGANESVLLAAHRMAELAVGALPVFGQDEHRKGVLTDRDIVTKVLAADKDPVATTADELAQRESRHHRRGRRGMEVLRTMSTHKVRRLPALTLVGMVAQADVARALPAPARRGLA
ncbi:CBS domain-containing protein [Streptomyces atratus]|uniref:CBS domain-containing protein n=1 Tax=Streptomyces atratus TaxID=1893 RepID=UPI0036BE2E97